MNWTKDAPTQEGYYWLGLPEMGPEPIIIYVFDYCGDWGFTEPELNDGQFTALTDDYCSGFSWFGPLVPPEEETA